jgi:hypothetical protein
LRTNPRRLSDGIWNSEIVILGVPELESFEDSLAFSNKVSWASSFPLRIFPAESPDLASAVQEHSPQDFIEADPTLLFSCQSDNYAQHWRSGKIMYFLYFPSGKLAAMLKILNFCKVCGGFPLLSNLVGMPNKGRSRGVSESLRVHFLHLCNILGNLRPLKLPSHL